MIIDAVENTEPVWISRYRMKARGFLNSLAKRSVFEGALIRIGEGFGCIHPWPELGDPPLEKCLADLAGPRRWQIVKRAMRLARYDEAGRQHEHSLFEEMEVPESHATLISASTETVAKAVEAGFTTIKLKMGRDATAEGAFLDAMSASHPQLKWRLDFNESLTPEQVNAFLRARPAEVLAAIDFLEDPCPYSAAAWGEIFRTHRVKCAVDAEAAPQSSAAQVMVIKPAIDEPYLLGEAALGHGQRVVVTSYMDHPVGQAFAAWEAARLGLLFPGLVGVCGLQTHTLFEPTEFSEVLGPWVPAFQPSEDFGIGFTDLLHALPWTRL